MGKPKRQEVTPPPTSTVVHAISQEGTEKPGRRNSSGGCSAASESSAAIVSVFNSWSSSSFADASSCTSTTNNAADEDGLSLDDRLLFLSPMDMDPEFLLDELKKRLPPDDLPPPIRKRRRCWQPTCRFINYFGTRLPPLPPPSPPPPSSGNPLNELGLDEKDALFPFVISGASSEDCSSPPDSA